MGLAVTKQEAFWEACGYGHTDRVKAFIEEGIDVNWVSYTHNCCAIHVASQGKPLIVQMLLEANCDINVKDDRGNLALHHAAMKGEADIMQTLITAGSQIDTPDKNGWTPLTNAAYWCQPEAVRVLLKNRACVSLQNKDDRTALHECCRSQSTGENELGQIASMLVEAGSDINAKSSDLGWADFTPLMFASYWGHNEVAKVLIEAQCDFNSQGSNGWTALHWAANNDNSDLVDTLLKAGVDPNIAGYRGEYPVDVTKSEGVTETLAKVTVKKEIYKPKEILRPIPIPNGDSTLRSENVNQNQNMVSRSESIRNEQVELRRDLHRKLQFRQDKRRKQIMHQNEEPQTRYLDNDEIRAADDDDDEDTSLSTLSDVTKTENGNITPGSVTSDILEAEVANHNEGPPKKERIPYFFEEELEKMLLEDTPSDKEDDDLSK